MKPIPLALVLAASLLLGLASSTALSSPAPANAYASFTGVWYHHGFDLQVTSRGNAYAIYRTYVWCSAKRRFNCDRISGNAIYDGGIWGALLGRPGGGQVPGTIYASADSELQGAHLVLAHRPQDQILLTTTVNGRRQQMILCGPHAPSGQCGA